MNIGSPPRAAHQRTPGWQPARSCRHGASRRPGRQTWVTLESRAARIACSEHPIPRPPSPPAALQRPPTPLPPPRGAARLLPLRGGDAAALREHLTKLHWRQKQPPDEDQDGRGHASREVRASVRGSSRCDNMSEGWECWRGRREVRHEWRHR